MIASTVLGKCGPREPSFPGIDAFLSLALMLSAACAFAQSQPAVFGNDENSFPSVTPVASAGLSGNYKRASRFTLSAPGTLQNLHAFLDGNTPAAGTQSVRMAIYRDNDGVPGAKIAESRPRTIDSGQA